MGLIAFEKHLFKIWKRASVPFPFHARSKAVDTPSNPAYGRIHSIFFSWLEDIRSRRHPVFK